MGNKAERYFNLHQARDITTQKPGDFHTSNQDAAYFTYDKEYARYLTPVGGKIIRQDVPREMLRNQYKFDDRPDDNWYHVSIVLFCHTLSGPPSDQVEPIAGGAVS